MNATIEDVMTQEVVWVEPKETLYDSLQILKNYDIRHLPVVDPMTKKVVGVLSEGDIILYCHKNGTSIEVDNNVLVEDAMTKKIVYCYPSSNVANVAATLIAAKINSIPVLDEKSHQLVGIVTTTDFLDQLCLTEELDGHQVRPMKFSRENSLHNMSIRKMG